MSEDQGAPAPRDAYNPPWERRGSDLNRLLSLSDGIFAFAMTLLVLSIVIPTVNGQYLSVLEALRSTSFQSAIGAYALVFVILATWWRSHNLVFTYLRGWDQAVIQLNMAFLGMIVLQPFLVHVLASYQNDVQAVLLYAGISALTGLTLCALWFRAMQDRRILHPGMNEEEVRWLRDSLLLGPAIFGVSCLIALANPTLAEFSWLAVFVVQVARVRTARNCSPPGGAPPPGGR